MRLLLDAMLPNRLGDYLTDHEVSHVVDFDWQHLSNGALLSAGEANGFEVLVTKDANMPHQQNLTGRTISLVILRPRTQDIDDLIALAPKIQRVLPDLKPGSICRVTSD